MTFLAAFLARRGAPLIGGLALAVLALGVAWRWEVLSSRAETAEAARIHAEQRATDSARALATMRAEHARQMAAVAAEMDAERQNAARLADEVEELRRDPSYDALAGDVLRRAVGRLRDRHDSAPGPPRGVDPGAGAAAALHPGAAPAGRPAPDAGPGGGDADAP